MVVYHLQNVSGKSRWKVIGTPLLGAIERKISGSNGTSEKVVLWVSGQRFQAGKSCSISSKSSLIPVSSLFIDPLYFLFKVRRARVIKYEPRVFIFLFRASRSKRTKTKVKQRNNVCVQGNQFQAFAVVFRWMELIWTNGKRDSGTKFTNQPVLT